ncbi:asparagine synthase (glutamine-hydrolyzing) [Streptomyces sp. TRM 70351]|uniref:asparagine synthase (glutamine-hydrolyzing) n=1 Tax=Streptomyces sp. TRM 70351 TaxID=3116552 RepID=UPI002E7AE8EC|nr:asparagine synthase (glutamine-hydrolyzing) [Streptomyces sp. TRM 70351]MEE1931284.1 asparagine synthase (glutamine-hydrolyzing) [Streptomyces sp. TRM 70351]
MCGIAGWISYQGELGAEGLRTRRIVDDMTQTMTCRGPDAGGVWTDTNAALGHRRLAVIDIEGGKQPMLVEHHGHSRLVITYSGEIYNHRELRDELRAAGHTFATCSDTEVALHAYLEWGEDFTTRLNGMYAFALWDSRSQQLLLVRDRLGIKPLFYWPTDDGVLFGSEPKAIFAHPDARPAIGVEGLAELFTLAKTPGHAIYQGMYEVRPGYTVRVRREGLTPRRYWSLQAQEHTDDLPATIARVRELLDDIVARQLVADVPLCTLLSGGLDSSVITALAAGELRKNGRGPVRSFALDFAGQAKDFRPDSLRGTPDRPYAHALARHVHSDHTDLVLDTAALADRGHRAAVQTARDLPLAVGEVDTSLYLLFQAIKERSTVALSGEGADELFGGYRWFQDGTAAMSDTFPWAEIFGKRGFSGDGGGDITRLSLLHPELLRRVDPEGYLADRYREALTEVPRRPKEMGLEKRMREISYLHLTRHLQFWLDRKDRMSMATGLEVRVPYCDHRLVEYVFNVPWSLQTFDGREKSLLRAAAGPLLPDSVLQRVKSPYPGSQDPRYSDMLRVHMRTLLADRTAPVRDLLHLPGAETAARSSGDEYRYSMEFVLALESWLRDYEVELNL